MMTMWHSGYGDVFGHIFIKKYPYVKKLSQFKFATKLPVLDEHALITITSFHMEKKTMQCYEKENHIISKIHLSQ